MANNNLARIEYKPETAEQKAKRSIKGKSLYNKRKEQTYFGKPDANNLSDDINEAVMRSVIRNIRILLADNENYDARSELAWASSMA